MKNLSSDPELKFLIHTLQLNIVTHILLHNHSYSVIGYIISCPNCTVHYHISALYISDLQKSCSMQHTSFFSMLFCVA